MLRSDFDVLVVGGGPAGSSAAHTLAAGGMDVCVIDKSAFPRDKLCGGLLTLRSRKTFERIFEASWHPVIEKVAHGIRVFHGDTLLTAVEDYSEISFTSRRHFDAHLLQLAADRGAVLCLGSAVASVDPASTAVHLANGRTLTGRFMIGADGVNSIVARTLFGNSFDKSTVAFGLEMEVPHADVHDTVTDPEIYLGAARWGYGWVFPKRDTLTVGVGGLHCKNADLKQRFRELLDLRFGAVPAARMKGHFIPFGDYRRRPGRRNVLLCGDAAGLVEPITGEGIAFAMESGGLAAQAILEAGAANDLDGALQRYRLGYRTIAAQLGQAGRLRYLIYPRVSERVFVRLLPGAQGVTRMHLDLMADAISYRDYTRSMLRKLGRSLVRGKLGRAVFARS